MVILFQSPAYQQLHLDFILNIHLNQNKVANLANQRQIIEPLLDWRLWLPPAIMSVALIGLAQYSYLMFHTVAELFAIVISFLIFAFAWSTRSFAKNAFLLFLACGYFWVGSLDLFHAFVYKGMNVFVEGSGNLSTQFWISARGFEAAILLIAPVVAARRLNGYFLVAAFGAVAAGLTTLIIAGWFPTTFVEGTGLTDFKIISEYLIDIVLALALVSLFRFGKNIAVREKVLIAAAIVLSMVAELAFTFYVDVYGFPNLVGHILKLFSFWLIFQAIVVSYLQEPYAALQRSEKRSRSLFENAEISIWNVDLSGLHWALGNLRQGGVVNLRDYMDQNPHAIIDMVATIKISGVNPATMAMFEMEDDDTFLDGIGWVFGEGLNVMLADALLTLWDGAKFFRSEATLYTFDGRALEVLISFPVPETEEGFRSLPVSIVDISDRKKAENEMLIAKDEAEKATQAKSEFLSSMSHELRTPLNAILGFAQILRFDSETKLSANQTEQVGFIIEAGNHLLKLVNQILDLSRIEANELELDLESVSANKVVSDCVALAGPLGTSRGIEITNELADAPESNVFVDQLRLKQILINFLSNAIKYNDDGGTVVIAAHKTENGFLHLSVTDTGIGIAEVNHPRVFRMLDRLGVDAALVSEGAGIGLAVAKLLVENMGGKIGFESQKDVGSSFWFELPLAEPHNATDEIQAG